MTRRRNDHDIADEIVALLESDEDKARHPDMEIRSLIQQARDAGGGGLRMQYLKQAQRAIAKLDPARHGRLINELQGQVLALQGRRGDSRMAHVTPGEVVVPPPLQTPEVLAALQAAAREAGIDPSRLIVGSRRSSVNPRTGQPEFAFGNSDMGYEPKRQNVPAEQKIADLRVNYFPKAAHGEGHIGISVVDGAGSDTGAHPHQTQGFYPQETGPGVFFGKDVPGAVKNDDMTQPYQTVVIPTSKEQDAAAQEHIDRRKANPGHYDLWNRQCTDFGASALRASGVAVPSDATRRWLDDIRPKEFFELLKRQYGPK